MKRVISLTLIFLSILVFLLFKLSSPKEIVAFVLSFAFFVLPGLPIGMALFGRDIKTNPESFLFGSVLGVSLSAFIAVLVGYWIGWNIYIIILSLLIISVILFILFYKTSYAPAIIKPRWEYNDYSILLIFLIIVLLSIAYPFLNVGKLTENGFAYTSLFGHDFILRVSSAASISQGMPPQALNYSGTVLQTYWLFYVFPAFVYKFSDGSFSLKNIMLLCQLLQALMFTSVLFSLLRYFLKKSLSLTLGMFIGLYAYSYYYFYILFKVILNKLSNHYIKIINDYGLTTFANVSHSPFRDFMMEPQATLCLSLIMVIIFLMSEEKRKVLKKWNYCIIGLIMGLTLGIDAFIGIIGNLWCSYVLISTFLNRDKITIKTLTPLINTFGAMLLVFISYYIVGMYSITNNSGLLIKPHKFIIYLSPLYFITEFGPSFICGMLGLIIAIKNNNQKYKILFSLIILTVLFVIFVRHNIEIDLGVRKGGYLLYIPLIILSGYFVETLFSTEKYYKKQKYIILTLIILAFPTLITDIYYTSNINNVKTTTYLSVSDYNACQWIKKNTPINAIIQSKPGYPGPYEYSLISCFAERAMVVGESKLEKFQQIEEYNVNVQHRGKDIREMFMTNKIEDAINIIRKYRIDYIYVGKYERKLYPLCVDKFENNNDIFIKVYSKDGVDIYKIVY